MFVMGYCYAIVWELSIKWEFADHALRLAIVFLALILFIKCDDPHDFD